jgi:hypothetical protein
MAHFLAKRTEADFEEWRYDRDFTAWKYAMWDARLKLPTQTQDGARAASAAQRLTTPAFTPISVPLTTG